MIAFVIFGTCACSKVIRELIRSWHSSWFRRLVYCLHRTIVTTDLVQLRAWMMMDQRFGTLFWC